jgi:hypothetical protein
LFVGILAVGTLWFGYRTFKQIWDQFKLGYNKLHGPYKQSVRDGSLLLFASALLESPLFSYANDFLGLLAFIKYGALGLGCSLFAIGVFKIYERNVEDKEQPEYYI